MSRTVNVESTRLLVDDVFQLEEVYLRHELPGGAMSGRLRRLNLERGESVAALIVNQDARTVVLVRQFRYPAYKRGSGWLDEVVAGIVDPGESPRQAIRREALEEGGFRVNELIRVFRFFPSPGGSSERITLFFAPVREAHRAASRGGRPGEGEDIEVVELPLDELEEALRQGRFEDAKTLLAVTWLLGRVAAGEV